MADKISIFWHRRDLRLQDNVGLQKALESDYPVLPVFIFDKHILDPLPEDDARVSFIYEELQKIRHHLQDHQNTSLAIYYGYPKDIFKKLLADFDVDAIYTNEDYEPYAIQRDQDIKELASSFSVDFKAYKDQVVFHPTEVQKKSGGYYLVFTPYMRQWKEVFKNYDFNIATSENHLDNLYKNKRLPNVELNDMGFKKSPIKVPDYDLSKSLLNNYDDTRDIPSMEGTSRLSPHLRFGTVGYRQVVQKALEAEDKTYLNELIWREFYKAILYHFPETPEKSFKPEYDQIEWRNDETEFERWKNGTTGYPIVDAGMRQLNNTGWMHNRLRMITGSFLCKHLLIDWRWGERYFAEKLIDFEQSSNVGGWQWVAGSGVDAAPYFRVFNPWTQTDRFDKDKKFIKYWLPEFDTDDYPQPMVDHKMARERCLSTYKAAVKK
ncbi:MAG: deoxyribodipyrimidine photo-lyase [Psychroflexus sp.]|nr:deoxyribodipyrimidine photo-lyase [Psychroflexus sp.]